MEHRASIWKEDKIVYKDICFECGSNDEIHYHHIIPFSSGGRKTIPLCCVCHGKVHDRKFTNHKEMIKEVLKQKKESGFILGRPVGTKECEEDILKKYEEVVESYKKGLSIRVAANKLNLAINTVNKVYKIVRNRDTSILKHDPPQGNGPV